MALSIFTISKTKQLYQYACCCPISYFSGMPRSHPTALSFCHPADGKQPHHLATTNFISQAPKKTSSQMFLSLPFFFLLQFIYSFPKIFCLLFAILRQAIFFITSILSPNVISKCYVTSSKEMLPKKSSPEK